MRARIAREMGKSILLDSDLEIVMFVLIFLCMIALTGTKQGCGSHCNKVEKKSEWRVCN